MRNVSLVVIVSILLTGCGMLGDYVKGVAKDDLTRTSQMAVTYNKPDVKQCSDFLLLRLNQIDQDQAYLEKLESEKVEGIASLALKRILIAQYYKQLVSLETDTEFQKNFDLNCRAVAGQLMLNVIRDSRTIFSR